MPANESCGSWGLPESRATSLPRPLTTDATTLVSVGPPRSETPCTTSATGEPKVGPDTEVTDATRSGRTPAT